MADEWLTVRTSDDDLIVFNTHTLTGGNQRLDFGKDVTTDFNLGFSLNISQKYKLKRVMYSVEPPRGRASTSISKDNTIYRITKQKIVTNSIIQTEEIDIVIQFNKIDFIRFQSPDSATGDIMSATFVFEEVL